MSAPEARPVKRARVKALRDQALEIVLDSSFLPWYEAVKVGATCKEVNCSWNERKDRLCEPALEALLKLFPGTNVCTNCWKKAFPSEQQECCCGEDQVLHQWSERDPRSFPNYKTLSTWDKCAAIAQFMAILVPLVSTRLEELATIAQGWRFDGDFGEGRFMQQRMPLLFRFAFNFEAAAAASRLLYGGIFSPYDILDDEKMRSTLTDLGSYIHGQDSFWKTAQIYHKEYHARWATLGRVLTRKLYLLAPFIDVGEDSEDVDSFTTIIPDNVREQMNNPSNTLEYREFQLARFVELIAARFEEQFRARFGEQFAARFVEQLAARFEEQFAAFFAARS